MPAAYQDQDGKWWKECSSTKQLFGGVDTKEELGEWFHKGDQKDGFRPYCREVTKEINKQYRQENFSKLKEEKKLYYQKNIEKIKETRKLWRQDNQQKEKQRKKLYNQTPSGLFTKYKKSAKQREINFTLTLEWFEEQMTKPEFNVCNYSGIQFVDEPKHPHSRSLDRISSTKGYTPDNVRWVCFKLNSWKGDLTLNEVAIMFKAMANHHNVDPFEILKKVA